MMFFPFIVFAVALSGAFSSKGGTIWPALFATGALFSAELLWQIIRRRKKTFEDKPSQ